MTLEAIMGSQPFKSTIPALDTIQRVKEYIYKKGGVRINEMDLAVSEIFKESTVVYKQDKEYIRNIINLFIYFSTRNNTNGVSPLYTFEGAYLRPWDRDPNFYVLEKNDYSSDSFFISSRFSVTSYDITKQLELMASKEPHHFKSSYKTAMEIFNDVFVDVTKSNTIKSLINRYCHLVKVFDIKPFDKKKIKLDKVGVINHTLQFKLIDMTNNRSTDQGISCLSMSKGEISDLISDDLKEDDFNKKDNLCYKLLSSMLMEGKVYSLKMI